MKQRLAVLRSGPIASGLAMFAATILAAWCATPARSASRGDTTRPNIVIFLADDWQANCLGLLGHPVVKTPNLDALCRNGFIFRNAYVPGSHVPAVCLPSRAMIQTGISYHRDNRVWNKKPRPDLPPTLAETIKAAGYASIRSGKGVMNPNHLDTPFDEHIEYQNTILGPRASMEMRGEGEAAARNADHLIRFVRKHAGTKPLFLYMASDEPHDPQFAPEEFYAMYRPEEMPLPPNFKPLHPFDNGEMTIRDEKMLPWPRTPDLVAWRLARYYASVSYWDREVGRVIDALKEAGEFDNTIFVVSGDNGLSNGEHGLVGKQNLYENGGMHVPLIVVGPGVPRGDTPSLAHLFDIYPTVCELAGIPVPEGLDAKSLAPVIQGRQKAVREVLFTTYKNCQKAVRDARWKLIRYPLIDKTQLFDLQADPRELDDLADRPEHAATIERLWRQLKAAQAAFGDTDPLEVEDPAPAEWSPVPEPEGSAAERCRVQPADNRGGSRQSRNGLGVSP